MTTALVTGAAGFVGSHLVAHLRQLGWRVLVLDRDAQRLKADPEDCISNLALNSDQSVWQQALSGVDVLFHLAGIAHRSARPEELTAINTYSPVHLARAAAAANVGAFVWLSSIKVLGETSSRPLPESAPYMPQDIYGASKAKSEQALLSLPVTTAMRLCIVRPPLIYGPGVKANFRMLLSLAAKARRGLPLPLGAARAPRSLLSVSLLCEYLVAVAERGERGIYHVADDQDRSVVQLLRELCAPTRITLLSLPAGFIRVLLGLVGRGAVYGRLFEPLQLDCTDSYQRLGWQPPQRSADRSRGDHGVVSEALIFLFAGFGITVLLELLVLSITRRLQLMAVPNARSSHQIPTPTLGGHRHGDHLVGVSGLAAAD